MCIVSVPDGQGPGRCCAGRAWLRGHRPVGQGSPLWGWGSHFSPPGCGPRRGVPRRSDERGRRASACLPNLVSATTRAATSCPGPVATLQREAPSQTEGVCLSGAHAPSTVPDDGGLARVSPGYCINANCVPYSKLPIPVTMYQVPICTSLTFHPSNSISNSKIYLLGNLLWIVIFKYHSSHSPLFIPFTTILG